MVSEDATTRERTSFQELLARSERAQRDRARAFMGEIRYGAEMKEPDAVEEAEGRRAIAKGRGRLVKSDQEMVHSMSIVFDARYAYCQGRVAGHYGWENTEPGDDTIA